MPPPKLVIGEVNFVPSMPGEDSCSGLGYITIEVGLEGKSDKAVRKHGFIVRALSGVHDAGRIPAVLLSPRGFSSRPPLIMWSWGGITPDADGHVRWRLQVMPLSPEGVEGTPVEVCVATDDSCAVATTIGP